MGGNPNFHFLAAYAIWYNNFEIFPYNNKSSGISENKKLIYDNLK